MLQIVVDDFYQFKNVFGFQIEAFVFFKIIVIPKEDNILEEGGYLAIEVTLCIYPTGPKEGTGTKRQRFNEIIPKLLIGF